MGTVPGNPIPVRRLVVKIFYYKLGEETIDSQAQVEQNGRNNIFQPEYPTVIYNRVPKTGSTAFTQIAYKLVKGKWLFKISVHRSMDRSPKKLFVFRAGKFDNFGPTRTEWETVTNHLTENQMYVLHVNTSVHSKNAAIMTIQENFKCVSFSIVTIVLHSQIFQDLLP